MQLSYEDPQATATGFHGQHIEVIGSVVVTAIAQAAALHVGVPVVFDATAGYADKAARAIAATGDVTTVAAVLGVSLLDPTYPQLEAALATDPLYRQGTLFPVIRRGRILLGSETALVKGTNPFVRFASGTGGTKLGALRADADTATAVAATWLKIIGSANVVGYTYGAVVEVNL